MADYQYPKIVRRPAKPPEKWGVIEVCFGESCSLIVGTNNEWMLFY